MSDDENGLAERHPLTWTFHRNTSRWAHNALAAGDDVLPHPPAEYPEDPFLRLPPPRLPAADFADLLRRRFSCRRFADRPLGLQAVSTLLHTGYGVLGTAQLGAMEFLERPVPSGGGLYPLELHLLARAVEGLTAGIHHYAVIGHGLELRREVALPRALRDYLFMGQSQLTEAPAILLISAVAERCLRKYGDRGYRYILLEAGHVAQNLNLAAAALGLGSCNIGGFFDLELGALLRIDPEQEIALYGIAVGHPQEGDRERLRGIASEQR